MDLFDFRVLVCSGFVYGGFACCLVLLAVCVIWLVSGWVLLYYWFGIGCLLIELIAADLCSSVVALRLRCCDLFGCAAV